MTNDLLEYKRGLFSFIQTSKELKTFCYQAGITVPKDTDITVVNSFCENYIKVDSGLFYLENLLGDMTSPSYKVVREYDVLYKPSTLSTIVDGITTNEERARVVSLLGEVSYIYKV